MDKKAGCRKKLQLTSLFRLSRRYPYPLAARREKWVPEALLEHWPRSSGFSPRSRIIWDADGYGWGGFLLQVPGESWEFLGCASWYCQHRALPGFDSPDHLPPPSVLLLMVLVPSAVPASSSSYHGAPFFPLTPTGVTGRAVFSWPCSPFLSYPPQIFCVLSKALWRKVF